MNQQEIKANMTQGTWIANDNYCIVEINKGSIEIWEMDDDRCMHDAKANAEAITHAINNTYGKGINPESVPDMFNALTLIELNLNGAIDEQVTAKMIREILKNATL
jgi:hypothetical protein